LERDYCPNLNFYLDNLFSLILNVIP